jgi:hypothetical protein
MREVPLEGGHAFGVLDPAIAARYRGMEQADSLVLDPHKWLGVPVDAGCALVQRGDDLRDAFSLIPPYLRQDADAAVGTFAEYGLEQTRPVRALETWATIAARGRAGIAAQVARANALARELATLVEREPELELAAAPETSIVAFRAFRACRRELAPSLAEAVVERGGAGPLLRARHVLPGRARGRCRPRGPESPLRVIAADGTEVHAQWCSGDGLVLVQAGCASTRSGRLGVIRSAVPGCGAPLQVQQQPEGPRGGLDVERVPPGQP